MPEACNFIKKSDWRRCFPVKFAKFLRTPFLQNNLRTTASGTFSWFVCIQSVLLMLKNLPNAFTKTMTHILNFEAVLRVRYKTDQDVIIST